MTPHYKESKKPDECFLITEFLTRRMAYPIAWLSVRMGVSANAVSILGGCAWILSIPAIIFAGLRFQDGGNGGWIWLLLSAALWNVGFILDVADGSVARMTKTSNRAGFFLDFSLHLIFNPMFLCSIGLFLNMVTQNPAYLLLGVLSVCGNWAPAIEAREHVLCELVASGEWDTTKLSAEQRYQAFADSPASKTSARSKIRKLRFLHRLAVEFICFPGQFMLFGGAVLLDAILAKTTGVCLPILRTLFIAIAILLVARLPFTLRREFRKLQELDTWMKP